VPGRDRLVAGEWSQSSPTPHTPPDDPSTDGLVQHHVRTTAGLVSLSWDPDQGEFVAARGQQTWGDARLGDLARTVGISIPAKVARELRRDEQLHPGPRVQIRPAYDPPPSVQPATAAERLEPERPAEAAWPPVGAYVVPCRHGEVAVAWDQDDRCFSAVTESKLRWRAEHLDDLAIAVGARIPRAYVEDLLRDAGRALPDWDPPSADVAEDWTEWQAAPVDVPPLLDRLPPGVASRLKPTITAPSRNEPGGVARVETARRAVRAEWGAWVDEADARRQLIENVDSVMQGLARGVLVHEAVRRLERVVHGVRQRVEVKQSPTLGAVARARQRGMEPPPSPVDRLHALRSRPAAPTEAVAGS
jgi:hypothetical protein